MKITRKFCETTIKETKHEIKEIDSKFQSNLPSTEYSNIKEQVSKNQAVTIQQLMGTKTGKYRQIKYDEQIPEKQTQNSSVKSGQPNQQEKNNNNQDNTKTIYAAALRRNPPIKHQNQQHDEIIRSNINTTN